MFHNGFRWRDRVDYKSCAPNAIPTPADQMIGRGDGTTLVFQLTKTYGSGFAPWTRAISKPVDGSVLIAVNGAIAAATDFSLDATTGLLTFAPGRMPASGASITAGYLFDVPVRFDTDYLEIDLSAFAAGDIPKIPLIEIIP